jgi:hypothetical protein
MGLGFLLQTKEGNLAYTGDDFSFLDFASFTSVTMNYMYGKAIPLQALTGPEGSRRLRLPEF